MALMWVRPKFALKLSLTRMQMGNYVGFTWAALVFPPLRYLELQRFGR
jgi:hypothetical protein